MGIKVANNAYGTLASSITNSATVMTLGAGQGARFPALGTGDYFYGTLIDTAGNLEIVKATARSTDTITIVRAQDGTTARAFAAGDRFELRPTAALFNNKLDTTGATGSGVIPTGTTAQRDGTPSAGYFRFNTDVDKFEGYNGTAWGSVGGGATGGGSDAVFILNGQIVTTNYTIPTSYNAGTFGPITINSGVAVTVPDGSTWTVV